MIADRDRRRAHAARRVRRGPGAAVAVGPARHQPARKARLGDGDLGHGRDDRPDPRPDPGRLADRQLQLALGVLHQPADRRAGLLRHLALHPRAARPRAACASTSSASSRCRSPSARCRCCSTAASRTTGSHPSRPGSKLILTMLSFAYFIGHTLTRPAGQSFVDFRLLKNPNYVTGLLLIFIVGVVLFATRALMPTMLQGLMGYPAALAGLVTAPSGLGTMAAMLVVGRLTGKVDFRLLLGTGFAITAFSLWQMTQLHAGAVAVRHRLARRGPGRGPGPGVRAAVGRHLRHAVAADARRRHGAVQPDPQHRLLDRHRAGAGAAGAQHPDRACLAGHPRHQRQPGAARSGPASTTSPASWARR